ncbi:KRFJ protein, partial [Xiphorhynchus elegans]|nr:KRFJ protein [Xiphorhynchus elegans]
HSCTVQCPPPVGTSCNEPCVVSCATSRVIIYPPPVVVTFPGPIISTCPQQAVVKAGEPCPGTSLRAEVLPPEPRAGRFVPKHSPG